MFVCTAENVWDESQTEQDTYIVHSDGYWTQYGTLMDGGFQTHTCPNCGRSDCFTLDEPPKLIPSKEDAPYN